MSKRPPFVDRLDRDTQCVRCGQRALAHTPVFGERGGPLVYVCPTATFSDCNIVAPRPHDEHCEWCDTEEFAAVKYGTLHHLSERAVLAVKSAIDPRPRCPECGSFEERNGCVTCADGWIRKIVDEERSR